MHIEIILYVTGGITALPLGLYFAPKLLMEKFVGVSIERDVSLMIIRHWGLLISLVGILLIWAALDPALRIPALCIASAEKAGMIIFVLINRKKTWIKGFWPGVLFDILCVGAYVALLITGVNG